MSVGAGVLQVGRATKRSLEEEERIHVSPASGQHKKGIATLSHWSNHWNTYQPETHQEEWGKS